MTVAPELPVTDAGAEDAVGVVEAEAGTDDEPMTTAPEPADEEGAAVAEALADAEPSVAEAVTEAESAVAVADGDAEEEGDAVTDEDAELSVTEADAEALCVDESVAVVDRVVELALCVFVFVLEA
jgi:hypothetical protein